MNSGQTRRTFWACSMRTGVIGRNHCRYGRKHRQYRKHVWNHQPIQPIFDKQYACSMNDVRMQFHEGCWKIFQYWPSISKRQGRLCLGFAGGSTSTTLCRWSGLLWSSLQNVGKTMPQTIWEWFIYTTYLWWFGGWWWFILVWPTLHQVNLSREGCHFSSPGGLKRSVPFEWYTRAKTLHAMKPTAGLEQTESPARKPQNPRRSQNDELLVPLWQSHTINRSHSVYFCLVIIVTL